MKEIDLTIASGAIFSEDERYRYALWRIWSQIRPILMVIGLNPSKAGAINNDPTVTRGIVRANRNGYGGLFMGNLYGYISTNPDALLNNGYAVGEFTDYYLKQMIDLSDRQLCGWGSFKPVKERAGEVLKMLKDPYCLGINSDGNPKHPLYVAYDVPMSKYELIEVVK